VYRLCLLLLLFATCCNAQPGGAADNGLYGVFGKYKNARTLEDSVSAAFAISDQYMDMDRYDEAQHWLNTIYEIYTIKAPTLFNYFLISRQAEVYYYNSLFQLGLQSSLRGLRIAKQLNDALLLADANNLTGLFYLEQQKPATASRYFLQGIRYVKLPPYPDKYLPLTQPHHVWGNLAESYEKQAMPDSALYCYRQSLKFARQINKPRGIAVALHGIGAALLTLKKTDSARQYLEGSLAASNSSKDFDVELVNYSSLAQTSLAGGDKATALGYLQKGRALIVSKPDVNSLFRIQFYDAAEHMYRQMDEQDELRELLEDYVRFEQRRAAKNTYQVGQILRSSINNETRVLQLQVAETNAKKDMATLRLYLAIAIIVMLGAAFLLYRFSVMQKLRFSKMRNDISKDLHDEIGATLSGVSLFSQIANERLSPQTDGEVKLYLNRIADNSKEMVEKMSDIVWAINPDHDAFDKLMEKLRTYASTLCAGKGIDLQFDAADAESYTIKDLQHRRNCYLILKEAINNAIKYAGATRLLVKAKRTGSDMSITVQDNGKGFDPGKNYDGNGMKNMHDRAKEMGAGLLVQSDAGEGTEITLRLG
jgi:signal transduction histidine kinase